MDYFTVCRRLFLNQIRRQKTQGVSVELNEYSEMKSAEAPSALSPLLRKRTPKMGLDKGLRNWRARRNHIAAHGIF